MRRPSHSFILSGMIIGAGAGAALQLAGVDRASIDAIVRWVRPVGDIFLRMIFMMVIPLIVSALTLGVVELGNLRRLGRVGIRLLAYTVLASTISVVLGIVMVSVFQPGADIAPGDRQILIEKYAPQTERISATGQSASRGIGEILAVLVPRNPVEDMARAFDPTYTGGGLLAIMFFALMIGAAMTTLDAGAVATVRTFLEGLYQICMRVIDFAMKLAPVGVGALLFSLTASFSFSMIGTVLQFMLIVLAALALHLFVTYPILLRTLGRMNPVFFFRNSLDVMLTAFSTSSSNATLPTALKATIEKLRVPKDAAHFVLTIGSTANQNGTALYEGVTVLFLAQCFGIHLDLGQQVLVVLLSILGGVGTAGVPGGSLPVIAMILLTVGIPAEGIGVIYGVDRILDMSRTVLNVTGDMTAAVYVGRTTMEGAAES